MMQVFNASIPKKLFERLMYIVCSQVCKGRKGEREGEMEVNTPMILRWDLIAELGTLWRLLLDQALYRGRTRSRICHTSYLLVWYL